MKIRIKFAKQGVMKFVGHLDFMRYFQKAMRRAGVDICYSEGFSPHQIMSFAAPLGVGLTSLGEYMDIEVKSTGTSDVMVKRINEEMAEGVEVLSYKQLDDSARNAMSIVAAADYTLSFRPGKEPENPGAWFAGLEAFLSGSSIPFTKKTKKGERNLDLKPLIYQYRIAGEAICLQLSTGSTDNLKPETVIEAYGEKCNVNLPPFALQIQRDEVYANLGDDQERKLVTLDQLGEDIE